MQAPDVDRRAPLERRFRHDERRDRRRPPVRPGLDRRPMLGQELCGEAVCHDLAVCERLGARDVVEVPVTEDDGDVPRAELLHRPADGRGVLDRHVGVVDQRVGAVDQRVAADAELERAVVDPVGAGRECLAGNPAIVEPDQVVAEPESAEVLGDHRTVDQRIVSDLRGRAGGRAPRAEAGDPRGVATWQHGWVRRGHRRSLHHPSPIASRSSPASRAGRDRIRASRNACSSSGAGVLRTPGRRTTLACPGEPIPRGSTASSVRSARRPGGALGGRLRRPGRAGTRVMAAARERFGPRRHPDCKPCAQRPRHPGRDERRRTRCVPARERARDRPAGAGARGPARRPARRPRRDDDLGPAPRADGGRACLRDLQGRHPAGDRDARRHAGRPWHHRQHREPRPDRHRLRVAGCARRRDRP